MVCYACEKYGDQDKDFCGIIDCASAGYDDGKNGPFDLDKYNECGKDYYEGFIDGCTLVDGNTRQVWNNSQMLTNLIQEL